jgi:hypothetical protein
MTSLAGGEPADLTPAQVIAGWDSALAKIDHVHHQAGNLLIDIVGDAAQRSAMASRFTIGICPRRTTCDRFVGSYEFELRRLGNAWVITSFTFAVKFVDGDLTLDDAGT